MKNVIHKIFVLLVGFIVFYVNSTFADSRVCKSSFINFVNDIRWEGIFPITIAGVKVKGIGKKGEPASEGLETDPAEHKRILCSCKRGNKWIFGLTVTYWEPARIIETTKVPWCFPTLGISMSGSNKIKNWKNPGSKSSGKSNTSQASYNVHYYIFNVFDILDIFVDVPCVPHEGFDLAYLSEIDPTWNNDVMSFVLDPEAILFGNPIAQLACAADSAAATVSYPIDTLFWCVGAWGSSYPMAGYTMTGNELKASAELAARTIARNARVGILWDPAINYCGAQITPIWVKSHYKMHLVKPKQGPIVPIGRASMLWETNKNPPTGTRSSSPDNFSWLIFRWVKCCMGKAL